MASSSQILLGVTFLDLLAGGLVVPQLPPHARSLGCGHLLIGTMGALYAAFQLLAVPLTGTLIETYGKKTTLLLTLSLCGLSYLLLGITSAIFIFLALRAFLGAFKHTQLLTRAISPDYIEDKSNVPSLHMQMNFVGGLAMSIAPVIGGQIMEIFPDNGFTIITTLAASIFALNTGLLRKLPEEVKKEKNKPELKVNEIITKTIHSSSNNLKQSLEQFYKIDWGSFGEYIGLKTILTLCVGVYFCNYALYLKTLFQVSAGSLGYITSLLWSCSSYCNYYAGYINRFYKEDKSFILRTYHIFLTLSVTLIGMVLAPNVALYIVCFIPLGISSAIGRTISTEMILHKADDKAKGAIQDAIQSIGSAITVIAPLIAGVIGHYFGSLSVIYFPIILGVTGAYLCYKIIEKNLEEEKRRSKSEKKK